MGAIDEALGRVDSSTTGRNPDAMPENICGLAALAGLALALAREDTRVSPGHLPIPQIVGNLHGPGAGSAITDLRGSMAGRKWVFSGFAYRVDTVSCQCRRKSIARSVMI